MRIVCPTCDATYDVPAPVVAARRTVRCTKCATQFPAVSAEPGVDSGAVAGAEPPKAAAAGQQAPPVSASPMSAPAVTASAPSSPTAGAPTALQSSEPGSKIPGPKTSEAARLVPGQAAEPTARRWPVSKPAAVMAGWALSLLLLSAGCGAAIKWRQPIMSAWPPSTRAYAVIGYLH